ncbi:MAG: hypothetical protein RLZZ546_2105, partial [Bacteroidota bacterium]
LEEIEHSLLRASSEGVEHIFMPNVDIESIDEMISVEAKFPNCHSMMGIHPCSVKEDWELNIKIIENWFSNRKFSGVGETGIDLYWDKTHIENQISSFDAQIVLSKEMKIPIIIHSRDSLDITIDMIEKRQDGHLTGVFHCFTGNENDAKRIIDVGFYMGIGGVVTYKNSNLGSILTNIGTSNLVLETDSPYLPPVPMRGKKNEPSFLKFIIKKLAEVFNCEEEDIAAITTKNSMRLFQSSFE